MTNLTNALEELRAERTKAQTQVEKLDQAISVIESLNGSAGSRKVGTQKATSQHFVSAAARRRMSLAQKARWAKTRKPQSSASAPKKHMSLAARRRIAAAQRARWARVRAQQKVA